MLNSGPFALRQFSPLLGLALMLSALPVQAQSADPVHVLPREHSAPAAEAPKSDVLSPHLKPFRLDVNLVLVPVTITDARNHPVMGLTKDDFRLYESGEQQPIRYFSTEDSPISVGVLLDISRSMRNKIDTAREALRAFFAAANPEDDYFVITFSDRPQLLADSTRSIGTVQAHLALAEPKGHTALLDAIYWGLAKLRSAHYRRRALLIISDGGDNHSRYRAREIRQLVQEADVQIYALGIFDSIFKTPEEWAGKRLLSQITEATGGRTVTVDNVAKLPEIARNVSLELRNQYVLGYFPKNAARDGKWRTIKVRLAPAAAIAQPQVNAKSGYFAPTGQAAQP